MVDLAVCKEAEVGIPEPVVILYLNAGSGSEQRLKLKRMSEVALKCLNRAGWYHVLCIPISGRDTYIEAIAINDLKVKDLQILRQDVIAAIEGVETTEG